MKDLYILENNYTIIQFIDSSNILQKISPFISYISSTYLGIIIRV